MIHQPRSQPLAVLVLVISLWCGVATAQGAGGPGSTGSETSTSVSDSVPALVAVGVSGGFPSYQTVALAASLQVQFVGAQVKGSWTPNGPYFALQLRAYPPLESPVPVFVGVGAGLYGRSVSYHAAVGAHVPLGVALRLDAEAGIASVPLLGTRNWAPHVTLGLSYAFPVELAPGGPGLAGERDPRAGAGVAACPALLEPDESSLMDAFDRLLDEWLLSARATYGSVYTDLDYSYAVTSATVAGDVGEVSISYRGSVRAIGSGTVHEADGSAEASFHWTGCTWSNTAISY